MRAIPLLQDSLSHTVSYDCAKAESVFLLQTRAGAEKAKDELNGIMLHDLDLKIGWGKAVVLPPIPVYTQSGKGGLAPMLAAAKAKAASAYASAPGLPAPAPWQAPPPAIDPNAHAGLGEAFSCAHAARHIPISVPATETKVIA